MELCKKCRFGNLVVGDNYFCQKAQGIVIKVTKCKVFKGKSKYHNVTCTDKNGITFDSKKELERWNILQLLNSQGEIQNLERQKKFQIVPKTPGERAAYYVADFVYEEHGKKVIEDVKSKITRSNSTYILKRKLVKALYPEYEFRES